MTPYWDNGITRLYQADAREIPLPDHSVHCCVTSPPYFGLRKYKGVGDRGIGLEDTFEEYLANLLQVFREVARVLRRDGVLFLNLGDAYSGSWGNYNPGADYASQRAKDTERWSRSGYPDQNYRPAASIMPQGHKLGIPERVVIGLQEDGWVWRDTFIWVKPAPMPSSVHGTRWLRHKVKVSGGGRGQEPWRQGTNPGRPQQGHNGRDFRSSARWQDCPGCPKCEATGGYVLSRGSWRSTTAHEYIYMLTRGPGYYSDGEGVKTTLRKGTLSRVSQNGGHPVFHVNRDRDSTQSPQILSMDHLAPPSGANRRSVWDDIKPEPYPGDHYAVFPSDLPRICIQIGTSDAGVCPECGAQWARVVNQRPSAMNVRVRDAKSGSLSGKSGFDTSATDEEIESYGPETGGESETVGWRPTCGCGFKTAVPATVLDPFAGTATTCLAAQRLGRRSVGVELSESSLKQAVKRLSGLSLPLELIDA